MAARQADRQVAAHALAHDPARATRRHRDAVEAVAGLHRALLVRHDQQLRLVAELVHEIEEAVQVHVVERGLDLVEQVEGRRPGAEHGEQERHRGQRALTTGEQRQPADVLARRARLHLDPGVEQVVGVGEEERPEPPGNSVVNRSVKFSCTSANASLKTVTISLSTALITRLQLAPAVLHVFELLPGGSRGARAARRTPRARAG